MIKGLKILLRNWREEISCLQRRHRQRRNKATKVWEARSRPGCQGPQQEHILEDEVDGEKSRVIREKKIRKKR